MKSENISGNSNGEH